MADEKTAGDRSNELPKAQAESKKVTKKKGRRWLKLLGGFLVFILLLVVLAPTLAGIGPIRSMILGIVNGKLNGKVEVDDWSLGWTSGITVEGLRVKDDKGEVLVRATKVKTELSLLKTLASGFSEFALGKTDIDGLDLVKVYVDESGTLNLEKLAKASDEPKAAHKSSKSAIKVSGDIHIKQMIGAVSAAGVSQKLRINPSDIAVSLTGLNEAIKNDIKLAFTVEDAGGTASANPAGAPGTITIVGEVDAAKKHLKEKLALAGVNLSAANPILAMVARSAGQPGLTIGGMADGAVDVTMLGEGNEDATGQFTVATFTASGAALCGDTFKSNLKIPIKITRVTENADRNVLKIAWLRVETDYGIVGITANVSQESLERLAKSNPPGRDGTLTVTADFDKAAALLNSMPHLFHLQEGVKVATARLFSETSIWLSKVNVITKSRFSLSNMTGTRIVIDPATKKQTEQAIALAPVEQTVDLTYIPVAAGGAGEAPGGEIRDLAYALSSSFANISGKPGPDGTLASFHLDGKGDLAQLHDQVGQFVDFGGAKMAGTFNLVIDTKGDPTAPSGVLQAGLDFILTNTAVEGLGAMPALKQPWMKLTLRGKLNMKDRAPQALTDAVITLQSNNPDKPTVDFLAKGSVNLRTMSSDSLAIEGRIADLAKAREEFAAFVPILAKFSAGRLSLTAAGKFDGKTFELPAATPLAVKIAGAAMDMPPEAGAPDAPAQPLLIDSADLAVSGSVGAEGRRISLKVGSASVTNLKLRRGKGAYDLKDRKINLAFAAVIESGDSAAAKGSAGSSARVQVTNLSGDLDFAKLKLTRPIALDLSPNAPAAAGGVEISGNLAEALRLLECIDGAEPNSEYPYAGDFVLAEDISLEGKAIRVAGSLKAIKFKVIDPKKPGGTPSFSEDLLTMANDFAIDLGSNTLINHNFSIVTQSTGMLSIELTNGRLDGWTNERKISDKFQAHVKIDWAKFWAVARPLLDPEMLEELKDMEIQGMMDRTFTLNGSFPATGTDRRGRIVPLPLRTSLRFLVAYGGISFDRLYVKGLDVRNVDLPVSLEKGILYLSDATKPDGQRLPKPYICNGGTIDVGGIFVDLRNNDPDEPDKLDPHFSIPEPNKKLFHNVSMNAVLAHSTLGKYINPGFAKAKEASGLVSLTSVEFRNVPLSWFLRDAAPAPAQPTGKKARPRVPVEVDGRGELNLTISKVTVDNFVMQILVGKAVHGDIKKGTVIIEKGIVSSDIPISVTDKSVLGFKGSVNLQTGQIKDFDSTVPKELINGGAIKSVFALLDARKVLEGMPDVIHVPFSGSLDSPKFDLGQAVLKSFTGGGKSGGLIPGLPGIPGIPGLGNDNKDKKDDKKTPGLLDLLNPTPKDPKKPKDSHDAPAPKADASSPKAADSKPGDSSGSPVGEIFDLANSLLNAGKDLGDAQPPDAPRTRSPKRKAAEEARKEGK